MPDLPAFPVHQPALEQHRNRIRGLIAEARDTSFGHEDGEKILRFQRRLSTIMLSARAALAIHQFDDFLAWTREFIDSQAPKFVTQPYSFRSLIYFEPAHPVGLERELAWMAAQLHCESEAICSFCNMRLQLEAALWKGLFADAQSTLAQIGKHYGRSFWEIELSIAIEQASTGLEGQKALTDKIRSERYVVAFVAYYTSMRNEPWITIGKHSADVISRMERSRIPHEQKLWYKFRLAGSVPDTKEGIASVLEVEQKHGLIDRYETFIAIIQWLISTQSFPELNGHLLAILKRLDSIHDFRLWKARALLNDLTVLGRLDVRPTGPRDALYRGDILTSVSRALQHLRCKPTDIGTIWTLAAAASASSLRYVHSVSPRSGHVYRTLEKALRKGQDFDEAQNELRKLGRNLGGTPSFRALEAICVAESAPRTSDVKSALRLRFLNDDALEAEDSVFLDSSSEGAVTRPFGGSESLALASLVRSGTPAPTVIVSELSSYGAALCARAMGDYSRALDYLDNIIVRATARSLVVKARLLRIDLLVKNNMLGTAIQDMATIALYEPSLRLVVPIVETINGRPWAELSPYSANLALSIVIDLFLRETHDGKVATFRRWAVEEFLKNNCLKRPRELFLQADKWDRKELIWFLDKVCVPNVLDMAPEIEASERAVAEERMAICAGLVGFDRENDETHQLEVMQISSRLEILKGLQLVDSIRLYVDEERIANWAEKELSEGLKRYQSLVETGHGGDTDFEVIVKTLSKQDQASVQLFELPSDEANDLLAQLALQLRDQFLFDPLHGLDSYLSKRIRHHSLAGYIRGPVDTEKLITKRDENDRYHRNEFWLEKLNDLPANKLRAVSRAFTTFAFEFDTIVITLRDSYVQIRQGDKKSRAMIDVRLNPVFFYVLKKYLANDLTVRQFVQVCFQWFWVRLEESLANLREFMHQKTKPALSQAFQRLQDNLMPLIQGSRAAPELFMTIGDASRRVQNAVDSVAEWLKRADAAQAKAFREMTLEQAVEIAIAAAQAAHLSNDAEIEKDIEPELRVSVSEMIAVYEVFWIALGNVYQRAKPGTQTVIRITGRYEAQTRTVCFRIVSESSHPIQSATAEAKLTRIRKEIEEGDFERVRTEGETGLLKLASQVLQSPNGRVEFGFESPMVFALHVQLSISDKSTAVEETPTHAGAPG